MRWLSCSVCQVPVAEGKSVQQTVDLLHKKLEQLGAVKQGSFCVDCETYHATANVGGKHFYLLTMFLESVSLCFSLGHCSIHGVKTLLATSLCNKAGLNNALIYSI